MKRRKHLFFGKLLPAVARRSHVYRSFFTDKGTVLQGKGKALKIDRKRFNNCIDHMARVIFFDAFGRKWQHPIAIVSPSFFSGVSSDKMVPHQPSLKAVEASQKCLSGEPNRGTNPEVFVYRVRYDEGDDSYAFAAIF